MATIEPEEAPVKEPERIATTKVAAALATVPDILAVAELSAQNSETAAHYAKAAYDSTNRFLLVAALGGVGLAIITVGSVLALLLIGLGTGHVLIIPPTP